MFEIRNSPALRTIYVRMWGTMDEAELKRGVAENKRLTETYGGQPHLMMADMRGWIPLRPELGAYLMEAMTYSRARGLACCVHLADSEIARLQAARLARESSPDNKTVNVTGPAEAEKVLTELRLKLFRPAPIAAAASRSAT